MSNQFLNPNMVYHQLNPVVDKIISTIQLKIDMNHDPLTKINSIRQIFIESQNPQIFVIFMKIMENDLKLSKQLSLRILEG
jgi:hypothetical protein